jgi:hypothetical protein
LGSLTPQDKATLINSIRANKRGTLSLGGNIGFNEMFKQSKLSVSSLRMLQELLKPILCKANGNI